MAVKKREIVSEINITPLVDTLLVLLIIFMVCAPAMTRTIGIELPEKSDSKAEVVESNQEKQFLMIGLSKLNNIIFENKTFTESEFFNDFTTLIGNKEPEKVFIQADKNVSYDRLVSMMVFLRNKGHDKIGLVFQDK